LERYRDLIVAEQSDAWRAEIEILQGQLRGLRGPILFEFTIPRIGRRVDVVLLVGPVVFVVEFKVHRSTFDRSGDRSGLGLRARSEELSRSQSSPSDRPVLVATGADARPFEVEKDADDVFRPIPIGAAQVRSVVDSVIGTRSVREWRGQTFVLLSFASP
jgi:hypothetical protein